MEQRFAFIFCLQEPGLVYGFYKYDAQPAANLSMSFPENGLQMRRRRIYAALRICHLPGYKPTGPADGKIHPG